MLCVYTDEFMMYERNEEAKKAKNEFVSRLCSFFSLSRKLNVV